MAGRGSSPDPSDAVELLSIFHSNRSAAYSSLRRYQEAVADADAAVKLRPNWFKAYSRLAVAHFGLGRIEDAFIACKKCVAIDPANEKIKSTIVLCLQIALSQYRTLPELLERLKADTVVAKYLRQDDFMIKLRKIQDNPNNVNAYLLDQRIMQALSVIIKVIPRPQDVPFVLESPITPMPPTQHIEVKHLLATAILEKDKGNDAYGKKDFEDAVVHYSRGLELVDILLSSSGNNTNTPHVLSSLSPGFMQSRSTSQQQRVVRASRPQNAYNAERNLMDSPISKNEIWVSVDSKRIHTKIVCATNLFQKGFDEVLFKGLGRAISNTVQIVEIVKSKIVGLHQNTIIGSANVTDRWDPLIERLLPIENTRQVSVITITLSKKELDTLSPGYQSPFSTKNINEHIKVGFGGGSKNIHEKLQFRGAWKSKKEEEHTMIQETNSLYNAKNCDDTDEEDDDCILLENNPLDETLKTDLSKELSFFQEAVGLDDICIVAERGQVACRDYPHARHLCGQYPFDKTPHETFCSQCYCYVCDIPAPCRDWINGHCEANEFDSFWKEMRSQAKWTTNLSKF